ncbi:hypothetical protein M0805_000347 [Coniferiporia weirii]|nr:hypothetical protein M0805_000347 [Coniferiporia weirii]
MFGGNNAFGKSTGTPGFGSFGNANTNQTPQPASGAGTGSLFGSFGGAGTANQAQNQAQTQGLGQPQQVGASTNTNSLFPSANASSNPLFGGKPASSLFGNTTPSGGQQPAGTGGGSLFGGGGGAFGSSTTAPATQGTNAFGASTAPAAGTGLFGSTITSAPSNQLAMGTGLFGQQSQQPAPTNTPSLFGQGQTQQPGTSLFGQAQPQPPAQQTGLFGNFGQSTTNPASSTIGGLGLLGNTQPGGYLSGLPGAGASTSSIFAPKNSLLQMQQQSDSAQAQYASLVQRIETVAQSWDSNSPQCRFQHFFYNLVDPSQVHMYGRPQNASNDALWQKAVRENPDPSCYVPALAVGFDDIQKRVEAQTAQATAHKEKLKELRTRIAALSSSHSATNAPRLHRAAVVQTQLQQRLVRLVQHLHLLIPSVRSSSIRPEEEALRSVLEGLEEEIKRPNGVGRLKGKLSELWAVIGAIESAREREQKSGESNVEWAVVDAEGMQKLTQILSEQQNGIAHLTKVVQSHQKDLDVILGRAPQERETDAFSNTQASQVLLGASMRGSQSLLM